MYLFEELCVFNNNTNPDSLYDQLTSPDLENALKNPLHPLYVQEKAKQEQLLAMQNASIEDLQKTCLANLFQEIKLAEAKRLEAEMAHTLKKDQEYLDAVTKMAEKGHATPTAQAEIRDRRIELEDKNRILEKEIEEIREKLKDYEHATEKYMAHQDKRTSQFMHQVANNTYTNADGRQVEIKIDPEIARDRLMAPSPAKIIDVNPELYSRLMPDPEKSPEEQEKTLSEQADVMAAKEAYQFELKAATIIAEQLSKASNFKLEEGEKEENNEDKANEEESTIEKEDLGRNILRALRTLKAMKPTQFQKPSTKEEEIEEVFEDRNDNVTKNAITQAILTKPLRDDLQKKENELAQNKAEENQLMQSQYRMSQPKPGGI